MDNYRLMEIISNMSSSVCTSVIDYGECDNNCALCMENNASISLEEFDQLFEINRMTVKPYIGVQYGLYIIFMCDIGIDTLCVDIDGKEISTGDLIIDKEGEVGFACIDEDGNLLMDDTKLEIEDCHVDVKIINKYNEIQNKTTTQQRFIFIEPIKDGEYCV